MKMVIGRKSKKNNIKPKQYKKSKRYGKSKLYNKTQRGGVREGWGFIKTNLNSLKEQAQQALNAKKKAMNGFITKNQSNINVEKTKTKILDKLDAAKKKIEALMSNLNNNNNVNIDNIVETEGAEEFIGLEDIALNDEQIEGQIEGPNDGQIEESNEESNEGQNKEDN